MPAPTNISFLTAQPLGSLPASVSLQVDDAGVTLTTYYSFVAATGTVEIGAFGRVDVAATAVGTAVYLGPATAPTQLLVGSTAVAAVDKPLQVPVTEGETYFVECNPGAFVSSPTTLLLDVSPAPNGPVPIGSFAVNDDLSSGFPVAFLSATIDYAALRYIHPFPFGEGGDTLSDGTVLVEDTDNLGVALYNSAYQLVAAHHALTGGQAILVRTCLDPQVFYVATNENPTKVYTVSSAGTVSSAEVLTAMTSCGAAAASNDQTILYHAFTSAGAAVRTWDLVGHAAGANLAAGIANYSVTDILVLGDDSIVVGYTKISATRAYQVLHYSPAGATLNTYVLAEPVAGTSPRLAYAIDDPNSFWVMNHPATTAGLITFQNVKVSDGSILHTRNHEQFEGGVYRGTATLTPVAYFGASFSCPFWVVRAASLPTTTTFTIRRQRRWLLPQSESNKRIQIPLMELLLRTGIGLLPDAAGSSTPLGVDPEVRLRISKDGGKTWGPERARSAGLRGEFRDRVRWTRATGNYRNGVGEVTVDAPVDWQWLAMMGDPTEGSS